MGLFSFNYAKPGPGVDKNAPKKKGFFLYFEIFRRKFFKLLQANMLYFLCSLPFLAIIFFLTPIGDLSKNLAESVVSQNAELNFNDVYLQFDATLRVCFALLLFIFWGSGPASASYAYVTRCFTREEHTWLLSDGKDKFKENFKQAILVVILDIVLLLLGSNALYFYLSMYRNTSMFIWMVLFYATSMLAIIYTFMHFYIYQIMVTFECSAFNLYKNALIIALGKAPMNFLLAIFAFAIIILVFAYIPTVLSVILSFLILISFVRFPIEFYASRTLQKIAAEMKGGNQ